ncbi:MAG: ERCC4 domain-containing protein [Lachnospiraceae bacterium]|nr:ERCC4 domain-containing protein [Lachnospiraceae bacterium]
MDIVVDTREKQKAIRGILAEFAKEDVRTVSSKLYVGDYMSLDNPRLVIDRKQNLTELCGNVCQQHVRFRAELARAQEHGIRLLILCEHGRGIRDLPDVAFWRNPRGIKRVRQNGAWVNLATRAMQGETLYKALVTMEKKYGCRFLFCEKSETGRVILDILSGRRKTDG